MDDISNAQPGANNGPSDSAEKTSKQTTRKPQSTTESDGKFGTFGGVFTPCTLTILGVIMFLRFGQVVGQAGLIRALFIVFLAKAITVLTTLSLSAIATNTRVKGGGAYFLISRSLGVEYGGAIGLVFFLAQAISVAMYIIGFSEAFLATFPDVGISMAALASIVNIVIFICVLIGAGWVIKIQYFILAVLMASLVSFFSGALGQASTATLTSNLQPAFLPGQNMFTMFALFFPAVTGIMAGANMSGDLRDPGKSIPTGTLGAVIVTALVYALMAIALAASVDQTVLNSNNMVVSDLAWSPLLVTAGIFAATLSSALGSMLGAPRILQALAGDEIYAHLRFFAAGSGPTREPRRATVLTFVVSALCILLGNLDLIAPIITMAFMITYGTLNLATFYESVTGNPSYRPRFRYCHWSTALAGAVGCVVVMFLISWTAAAASIVGMVVLHRLIALRKLQTRWGDVKSGVVFEKTRRNLLRLEQENYHPKNWRPIVLALSGGAWSRQHLAVYGHWLTSGHGVLTLAQVIPGDVDVMSKRRESQARILRKFIIDSELDAFSSVVCAEELADGIRWLVQCHGIGGLKPNTVLLGWPNDSEKFESFGRLLRTVQRLGKSSIAVRCSEDVEDPWRIDTGTIDVWWRGEKNGGLMLLLAHLLKQQLGWRNHQIRLLRVVRTEEARIEVVTHLTELSRRARISATTHAIVSDDPGKTIQLKSRSAAVVFLGLGIPEEEQDDQYCQHMERFVGDLQTVVFVDSAGDMSLDS
jgi:amino acid transporter